MCSSALGFVGGSWFDLVRRPDDDVGGVKDGWSLEVQWVDLDWFFCGPGRVGEWEVNFVTTVLPVATKRCVGLCIAYRVYKI